MKKTNIQRFISDAQWDDDNIMIKYRSLINEDLGSPDGVLIFDETGFVKKGNDSIGVAKQYCGTIGKVENCQVGVFSAYASEHGYGLVDKRLYIPKKWFSDEYHHRRVKCKLPEEVEFRTKPQLAAEMLTDIAKQQTLPFKFVLGDSIYGTSPVFICNAPDSTGLKTLVWLRGMRWAIEQCFEETKSELGMEHYEVRKFMGWHHHILTCMLAHFFLWHLKIRLGKKSTIYYAVAA